MHMADKIMVTLGQIVKKGDVVLQTGNTGNSTGPHAHFEVRLNGVVTDPMPYITNGLIPETQNKDKEQNKGETQESQNTTN